MSENTEHGILSILGKLKYAQQEGLPVPKLAPDTRRAVVVHLLDEGVAKIEIASILQISRTTLWEDQKRISEGYTNNVFFETVNETAERINRRFDHLYSKAVKTDDYRLALEVECRRIDKLQSIGMVAKNAERIEIGSAESHKDEIIESLLADLGVSAIQVEAEPITEVSD